MSDKGWGYSNLIGFLAAFGIFLILAGILYNKNFSDINKVDGEEDTEKKINNNDNQIINYEEDNGNYTELELQLENGAEEYINFKKVDGNYKTIISSKDIIDAGYMEDIIDPKDNHICSGYVIYYEDNMDTYINCDDNYKTLGYDSSLE